MAEKGPFMARGRPYTYPPDFRLKIIELARNGRSLNSLAEEFQVGRQTVRNWVKQSEIDTGLRDGLTSEERAEVSRLKREVKRLTVENEILSKAAAWFARETDVIPKRSSDS